MPAASRRLLLSPVGNLADANARVSHPAERGCWIWHPDCAATQTAFLRFRRQFSLPQAATVVLHVTADQRFQLRCDGQPLTFGPDRCDLEHWTVHTLEVELAAGPHELEALAWFIATPSEGVISYAPPMAQMTWRGGFLLFAEGAAGPLLNTGESPWSVEDLTAAVGLARQSLPGYHDVGPIFELDLARWFASQPREPEVIMPPLVDGPHGVRRPGWCLYPAVLPEQRRERWLGGRIRAVRPAWSDGPWQSSPAAELGGWPALLAGQPVQVPANSRCEVLWDFDTYCCGYPDFTVEGGAGATLEWNWAEALYVERDAAEVSGASFKHHRGEIDGKVFVGLRDSWKIGPSSSSIPALWWRAGRYVRLRIATADTPLTITHLGLSLTGFPLESAASWQSADAAWDHLMPLFQRAFRCAAHETWTDTPYYEQMCYVGDNVLCALSNYAWFADDRISRRSIQLYEWSRRASGFVAERYPSRQRQESSTFSLLWLTMVRDYAWWRNDYAFLRSLLPGLRSVIAEFEGLSVDGMLKHVPGWPFIDWCAEWREGCAPGVREGDSSMVNLHWVLALQAAAQVEDAVGDPRLARRNRDIAESAFQAVLERYWDSARGLIKDTTTSDAASEYVQAFALLSGLLGAEQTRACLNALTHDRSLVKASIYASFYVIEALYRHGESAEFHRRLKPWLDLPAQGFTSTPEQPEPSRSDAHPWGAHPAWHTLASIAGVRPAAAGFTEVLVAPCPGELAWIECSVNHPKGSVGVKLQFGQGGASGTITLPPDITGTFRWARQELSLKSGANEVTLAPRP